MNYAERLNLVRVREKMSQVEFSKKVGISVRSYKNYETELRSMPSSVALKIHSEFGVNIHWLFTGEGWINAVELDKVIKVAVIETREFFDNANINLTPEKEAQIICSFVGLMMENGSMSDILKNSFFKAVM